MAKANIVGAGNTLFIPNKANPAGPTADSYGTDARTIENWAKITLGSVSGNAAAIVVIENDITTINADISTLSTDVAAIEAQIVTIDAELATTGNLSTDYQVGTAPPAGTRLTDAMRSRTATATFGFVTLAITGFSYGYSVVAFPGDASQSDSVAFDPSGSSLTALQFVAKLSGSLLNAVPCTINYRIVGA